MKRKRKHECDICGRKHGDTTNRCGDSDDVPLGPVEKCDTCGRWACPDCEHEADCCFAEAEANADDPTWAPEGWRVGRTPKSLRNVAGIIIYERV